jgi:hypothetical protein
MFDRRSNHVDEAGSARRCRGQMLRVTSVTDFSARVRERGQEPSLTWAMLPGIGPFKERLDTITVL